MPIQPTEIPEKAPFNSKRAKWRKLNTIADVRMALASVVRRVFDGDLDHERGAVCSTGLRALGHILKEQNLAAYSEEDLIAELRQRLGTRLAPQSVGTQAEGRPS